ncbi:sulfotransferase family 2 domain-containing protein [Synechococcus sp. CCY9202]|uniref:sulfotransferase family 2 domain-containing protein n=1 Tax=Synechococcus sp. CCY9202 TaxID=174698 RepID=UPI002B1F7720|nr:sulfotransferase family 2 domain-containing protein [Synechococcus sp. CCY9202]
MRYPAGNHRNSQPNRMGYAKCVNAKVIYHPAPKNAGSSMRQHLFRIDNGRPYEPMLINGVKVELFMIYGQPTRFEPVAELKGFERITMVRDPISRFLSAYANRVLDSRWRNPSHAQRCKSMGLPAKPDLETFLANLNDYQSIPEIAHHTRTQRFFLGNDLSYYDKVFRVEELASAIDYINSRAGMTLEFPRLKTDGPKLRKQDISEIAVRRLMHILCEDYELLGSLYS